MKNSILLLFFLATVIITSGCATSDYMSNRYHDSMDIFTLTGNWSMGARARGGPISAGFSYLIADYGLGGGQIGPITAGPAAAVTGAMTDFTFVNMETFKITPDYRNKSYESMGIFLSSMAKLSSEKKIFWPYYTQVETVAGVGYGVRFGFNIGEFIDFLLGWTTIDIYGDDIGIIKSLEDKKTI